MIELKIKKIKIAENFSEASADYIAKPELKLESNDYAYALGIPEQGFVQPGHLKDAARRRFSKKDINSDSLSRALIQDGLEPVRTSDISNYAERPLIACFIAQAKGYHFYRRHKDGSWSHQGGRKGAVKDYDNNGDVILDPRHAERGKYTEFVGYFAPPSEGLTIARKLNWFEEKISHPCAELKKWACNKL
tara:strand:+ start:102188 stop:102760 length:573 start_codon:yes stop_codon:yes gene_type:complete